MLEKFEVSIMPAVFVKDDDVTTVTIGARGIVPNAVHDNAWDCMTSLGWDPELLRSDHRILAWVAVTNAMPTVQGGDDGARAPFVSFRTIEAGTRLRLPKPSALRDLRAYMDQIEIEGSNAVSWAFAAVAADFALAGPAPE
jgi:hypothetical protein